ncbi:MAG TPA: transglycosylase SLT domain-containing protein [Candidatus Onthomorpha intestinigallinarum]|uniref:Transglycosylase SLT domain-containing protein n=1 Tax=Candidatus Onthomorpha intestinigallinarum TaxID=2840880 RepID=A0A9D1UI51_9BACT|nr:transglycosylase SLT domain-containing protein [Candidatus Onthomorpha intestinigallinarum]
MRLVFFTVIFSLFVCTNLFAQDDDYGVFVEFERNYDSLLQGYYMKQIAKVRTQKYDYKQDYSFVSAASVPDSVMAGRLKAIPSVIPLTYNDKVRAHIIYYVDKIGDRVGVMLGLSRYYFPIFENILDRVGVPSELKYLVVIESALNPRAVSRVGATGLWQFMYATGRMYDLRVNSVVDDRRDPIKSTLAAAKYLKDLYGIYNDWTLALAAYNCGPGNVNKAIRRSGKDDFWGIYDFLPRETRSYVPAYIAATYVMNYYKEHGIKEEKISYPYSLITDTIMVRKDVHFGQISSVLNIPFEQLRDLNPQYKMDMIPGAQGNYSLKMPLRYINDYISLEDSISNYDRAKYFEDEKNGEELLDGDEVEYRYRTVYHKIRRNETWSSIARKYGVNVSDLKKWNPKASRKRYLYAGQLLAVKQKEAYKKQVTASAQTEDETKVSVEKSLLSSDNQAIDNQPTAEEVIKKTSGQKPKQTIVKHKVKKGETVGKIAKKYGVSEAQIRKLNNMSLKSSSRIKAGQVLRIK